MDYEFAWFIGGNSFREKEEGAVMPYGDGPTTFYPESIGKNVYLNMIHAAKSQTKRGWMSGFWICDRGLPIEENRNGL